MTVSYQGQQVPDWYPGYIEYYNQYVNNAPSPAARRQAEQAATAYYNRELQNDREREQRAEQDRKTKDERSRQNIIGIGGPFAGAVGLAAGQQVADLLGLGKETAKDTAEAVGTAGAATQGANALAGAAPAVSPAASAASAVTGAGPAAPEAGGVLSQGVLGLGRAAPSGAGPFSGSGFGAAGNYLAPALGAVGLYDTLANNRQGIRGVAQGAASGAALGSFFPGPGTAIGAGVGGLLGLANSLFDSNKYLTEYNRKKDLVEQGVLPQQLLPPKPQGGRSKEELIKEAQATGGNVKFAQSRNEADLTPIDTAGYAVWGELLGPSYYQASQEQRLAINDFALKNSLVNEHHGTIDLKSKEPVQEYWQTILKKQ